MDLVCCFIIALLVIKKQNKAKFQNCFATWARPATSAAGAVLGKRAACRVARAQHTKTRNIKRKLKNIKAIPSGANFLFGMASSWGRATGLESLFHAASWRNRRAGLWRSLTLLCFALLSASHSATLALAPAYDVAGLRGKTATARQSVRYFFKLAQFIFVLVWQSWA